MDKVQAQEMVDRDLLNRLFQSTSELHKRFPGVWSIEDALKKFSEECMEFTIEAMTADPDSYDVGSLFNEMVDVIVTMMSVVINMDLPAHMLVEAIETVIAKNNAKTSETHERVNGTIVKRQLKG